MVDDVATDHRHRPAGFDPHRYMPRGVTGCRDQADLVGDGVVHLGELQNIMCNKGFDAFGGGASWAGGASPKVVLGSAHHIARVGIARDPAVVGQSRVAAGVVEVPASLTVVGQIIWDVRFHTASNFHMIW